MKKIMVSVILIGLLIVIQNAFGFTFRGIEVGKALNEQMPRCIFDEFIKNREKYNYDLEKFRKDNNYDPKQICWSNYGQADSASFSVEHLPTIDIGGSVYVKTLDEKVEYITMNFGYFNADRFLTILKAKYGEPVIKKSAV